MTLRASVVWTGMATWRWSLVSVVASVGLLALFVRIGGDWDWLVAMGDHVRATRTVPDEVPFAVAETSGWHNVPVLAEVTASLLHEVGPRVPVLAHLVAVTVAVLVLAGSARARGGSDAYAASAVALLCLGGLAAFGVVRAQSLSFVPFALMVALVSSQSRCPDRRIWWAVPLVVLWGNLHGAALLGVCVLGAYLLVQRTRTHLWESVGVGAASLLALCATPQLWRTPLYYAEVFDNVSAQRGEGLWARPSPAMPFDVVMLVAAALLLAVLLRSRRTAWEYVAALGLCVTTASAARHGVWLLCLLVVLAVRSSEPRDTGVARERPAHASGAPRGPVAAVVVAAVALAVALPVALTRGEDVLGQPSAVVREVAAEVGQQVALVPAPLSEALAVEGVRLWATNPLDAFTHRDQAAYLDFLDGRPGGLVAVAAADVVVARDGSAQAALVEDDQDFEARPCGEGWICFVRR